MAYGPTRQHSASLLRCPAGSMLFKVAWRGTALAGGRKEWCVGEGDALLRLTDAAALQGPKGLGTAFFGTFRTFRTLGRRSQVCGACEPAGLLVGAPVAHLQLYLGPYWRSDWER